MIKEKKMSKKTKKGPIEWITKWFLTTLFGMMRLPENWLSTASEGHRGSRSSVITIKGRDGSQTKMRTDGSVSSHIISSTPGTTVTVTTDSDSSFPPRYTIIGILMLCTFIVAGYATVYEPPTSLGIPILTYQPIIQVMIFILSISYLVNLISLFVRKYIANKKERMKTGKNLLMVGSFLAVTVVYLIFILKVVAAGRLGIYIPFVYFLSPVS